MKTYKTYIYRIYPTKKQEILIQNNFKCCNLLYKKLYAIKKHSFIEYKKYIKKCTIESKKPDINVIRNTIDSQPTLKELKEVYKFLKTADSIALCRVHQNLNCAYTRYYKHLSKFPKYSNEKEKYITKNINNNIRIEKSYIRLPKIGFIKINYNRKICGIIKEVCIIHETEKYFVKVNYIYENEIKEKTKANYIGLDFKIDDLFISSENIQYVPNQKIKELISKSDYMNKILSTKDKKSKNYTKLLLKLKILNKRIKNLKKTEFLKIAKEIEKIYSVACVEDLNVENMNVVNMKSIYDTSYFYFTKILENTLNNSNKKMIRIYKYFPSSKTCSNCNSMDKNLKITDRIYNCKNCGFVIDRDLNAAINIKKFGIWMNENKEKDPLEYPYT